MIGTGRQVHVSVLSLHALEHAVVFPLFLTPKLPDPRKVVIHVDGRNRSTAQI